MKTIKIL